jgi:hypothetical protein
MKRATATIEKMNHREARDRTNGGVAIDLLTSCPLRVVASDTFGDGALLRRRGGL